MLVSGRVGIDFGLNKGTSELLIIQVKLMKPAHSTNSLLAAGYFLICIGLAFIFLKISQQY